MQVGETVTDIAAMASDECVICSKKHAQPKKEEIGDVAPGDPNWSRKSMAGVLERTGEKLSIYPDGSFPPRYAYQGHHCIALRTLVQNANKSPKDRILRLNHFLKKVGFYRNREKNCIGLPEMASKKRQEYDNFWRSVDEGKPLQLHGPGHDRRYFGACTAMMQRLLELIVPEAEECEKKRRRPRSGGLHALQAEDRPHSALGN